ncbi:MAG: glycosyltransferase [Deltaproteobacteria bacterium]|nr:glycosyltransferase [Deltaproteobacteria bacterium]
MESVLEVPIQPAPLERFVPIVGAARVAEAQEHARYLRETARDRTIWNVNSTAAGGGVAEMLRSLLAYARSTGVDVRWLVIRGGPEFFHITKRLHNALHGESGDGTPLGLDERAIYEATLAENTRDLLERINPRDVVLLHDPQTAGLVPVLQREGARVIWRSHVGTEKHNAQTELGWAFLEPYLRGVHSAVFSRAAYVPAWLEAQVDVIVPSIDPFSAKNYEMPEADIRSILAHVGLVQTAGAQPAPLFHRDDGTTAPLERCADVLSHGSPPPWDAPLVVQVSRWDELKDPLGVVRGFAQILDEGAPPDVHLIVAGPHVNAVADDPEGPKVFDAVVEGWRGLRDAHRGRVHLANLPMHDVEENAAIVNALQRHARVVVQKSIREGFGLTVTEAMWKSRPVVASAIGGIVDQIDDGVSGLLLRDPHDLMGFGKALLQLLGNPELAAQMGKRGHERVVERFLGVRHLMQYAAIIERLDALEERRPPPVAGATAH